MVDDCSLGKYIMFSSKLVSTYSLYRAYDNVGTVNHGQGLKYESQGCDSEQRVPECREAPVT
jgi:hypothetical protein